MLPMLTGCPPPELLVTVRMTHAVGSSSLRYLNRQHTKSVMTFPRLHHKPACARVASIGPELAREASLPLEARHIHVSLEWVILIWGHSYWDVYGFGTQIFSISPASSPSVSAQHKQNFAELCMTELGPKRNISLIEESSVRSITVHLIDTRRAPVPRAWLEWAGQSTWLCQSVYWQECASRSLGGQRTGSALRPCLDVWAARSQSLSHP